MSDYKDSGSVENESYCMPSWQKRNTDSMNDMMGYHNMSDRANTAQAPTPVKAAKSNPQLSPTSGTGKYNY